MQTQTARQLGEIASIEEQLASVIADSVRRVQDPEMKDRMRRAAGRHRQHSKELLTIDGVEPVRSEEVAEKIDGISQRVEHAVGQNGLMAALGHLEQEEEVRLGEVLAADIDPEMADRLRAQQSDVSDDVRVFLDEAAGGVPGLGRPRNTR